MRIKLICITVFALLLLPLSSFAYYMGDASSLNKQCDAIADACKSAGYTDEGMGEKSFWFGCMKPVLFGKFVEKVTVDTADVKECRKAKIAKMQRELNELQAAK